MFWKRFGTYGVIVAFAMACVGFVASQRTENDLRHALESSMNRVASLALHRLEPPLRDKTPIANIVKEIATDIGWRLTVLDVDGVVLANSDGASIGAGDPFRLSELASARSRGIGWDERPSGPHDRPILHFARKIGDVGYLRLSAPIEPLMNSVRRFRLIFLGGAASAALLVAVVAWIESSRFARRLGQLTAFANAATRGDRGSVIRDPQDDPVGVFAYTVEHLRLTLIADLDNVGRVRKDLQTMLETMPEGVMAMDNEQRILFANQTIYRLFNLPSHDVSGQKLWEVLRHSALQSAVGATFSRHEPYDTEFELLNPFRVLSYRARPLTVDSGIGVIIVLHDITELRRLERLRQEFFANVSHELKTPLASIKAFTETLLDDDVINPETTRRFLERIEEQADRLHALVMDMLLLARAESRDHGFDVQPIDLQETVAECVQFYREEAHSRDIALTAETSPAARWVLADAEGLSTILRNLVDNAVKYTPEFGKIEITTDVDDRFAAIRVSDTGVGIPKEDLNRIFERFYRVDKARSRAVGGTGLGLSIVKHLTQTFGGSVSVSSRPSHGSTFTVRLPLAGQLAPTESELPTRES